MKKQLLTNSAGAGEQTAKMEKRKLPALGDSPNEWNPFGGGRSRDPRSHPYGLGAFHSGRSLYQGNTFREGSSRGKARLGRDRDPGRAGRPIEIRKTWDGTDLPDGWSAGGARHGPKSPCHGGEDETSRQDQGNCPMKRHWQTFPRGIRVQAFPKETE
jgi:hypothetical protein